MQSESNWDRLRDVLGPLSPLVDGWLAIVVALSWLLTRVVLILAFFTGFLVYGVVLRLLRRDPLSRQLRPDSDSYWGDNIVNNDSLDDFRKQY
jgi:hypothetical protein